MTGIETMANALTTTEETPVNAVEDRIIQSCLEEMENAIDSFAGAQRNAFDAAIRLGNAAGIVREKLPHGAFGPWVTEHFGPDSKRPLTVQWIRVCINAAKVLGTIKNENKKRKLIAQYGDVRAVAQLLPVIESGGDPLEPPVEAEVTEVATTTADAAPAAAPTGRTTLSAEAMTAYPEIGKREKELDKREKELDKREARLVAREEALDVREAKLKERETALKAKMKASSKGKGKVEAEAPPEAEAEVDTEVPAEVMARANEEASESQQAF